LRWCRHITRSAQWLRGQLVAMLAVGALTGLGAALIGLPSALALGLLAGLLEFVPIVGPIFAAIPALLLAATLGWSEVLWTLALFIVIQQIEGNMLMPAIMQKAVELPPAVTLFAVLAFGLLFGPLGVLLATPLAVVLMVLVQHLYLRDD
jgi:predicted PurR-regulated permease PerM